MLMQRKRRVSRLTAKYYLGFSVSYGRKMEIPVTQIDQTEAGHAWFNYELQTIGQRIEDVRETVTISEIGEPEVYYRLDESVRHWGLAQEILQSTRKK